MADFNTQQQLQPVGVDHVGFDHVGVDYFDLLPDPIVLDILNRVVDAKSLCRCVLLSKRFASLVPQIDSLSIRMSHLYKKDSRGSSRGNFLKGFVSKFVTKPIQFLMGKKVNSTKDGGLDVHRSVGNALRNFNEIQSLKIELPCFGGEIGGNTSSKAMIPLLKWEAGFGKELEKCVILGATSIAKRKDKSKVEDGVEEAGSNQNNTEEDEPLFSDEELKMRIIWIISCLIASSARHNLVKKVLNSCPKLSNAVISDGGNQGKLCMNAGQIKELRDSMKIEADKEAESGTSTSNSSSSQMGYVGNLVMKLWYVKELELKGSGEVMKGATMVVIRPDSKMGNGKEEKEIDGMMMKRAFGEDEVFGEAVHQLLTRKEKRVYRLEMNTF